MTSSFRRKSESLAINGTRISYNNAQLLTSSGSCTLDTFLGGGLAVGTVNIIEEDFYQTYSTLFLKYFLAEGIANKHSIFLASGDINTSRILKELPAVKTREATLNQIEDEESSYEMKIAWRYKNIKKSEANNTESYGHSFDIKTVPPELLEPSHAFVWDPSEHDTKEQPCLSYFVNSTYMHLLQEIQDKILSGGFKTSTKSCTNILRIGVCSIGSPLWCDNDKHSDLLKFLYALKSLLRSSFAVALITVPSILLQDNALKSRLRQLGDTVLELESFVGSDKKANPLFKDLDGLFYVRKLPVLNTFMYPEPSSDLGFKIKRKGIVIKRLHLPPEFEESEHAASGCGGHSTKLDF